MRAPSCDLHTNPLPSMLSHAAEPIHQFFLFTQPTDFWPCPRRKSGNVRVLPSKRSVKVPANAKLSSFGFDTVPCKFPRRCAAFKSLQKASAFCLMLLRPACTTMVFLLSATTSRPGPLLGP